MRISKLLAADRIILFDPAGKTKENLIEELFQVAVRDTGLEEYSREIRDALLDRERSMSTGIGQGVAIPHCSSERIADVHGALALLSSGLEYQAVDGQPVRVAVLLLLPKKKFEKHINTLAAVARMFNNPDFRVSILNAGTPETAAELIVNEEDRVSGASA